MQPPLSITVRVSTTDEYTKSEGILTFDLEEESEVLDLKPVSE